jgi:hypothetical protein
MGVTPTESHDDGANGSSPGGAATPSQAPTSQLLSGAVGDRCANCGAPLASDQRYCVQCGERRGKSRFSPGSLTAPPAQTTTTTASRAPDPSPRRAPSGATVVAGIATLVLALGVGVEIGRIANNGNNSGKAPAAQVITVNGGGGASSSGSSAQTTTAGGGSSAAPKAHHHAAAPPPKTEAKKAAVAAKAAKPTQKAVQNASHAASSVLGGSGGQSNNTVTTGQSCAAGSAGCQGGHFTGTFFGQ